MVIPLYDLICIFFLVNLGILYFKIRLQSEVMGACGLLRTLFNPLKLVLTEEKMYKKEKELCIIAFNVQIYIFMYNANKISFPSN